MTISQLCRRHPRVALDSNVLIYLLEGREPWSRAAAALLGAFEDGAAAGYLAAVGLAEVLAGPARAGDLGLLERYDTELRGLPGLTIVPFGVALAADAAVIRGLRDIPLPDAMHLASARSAGATAFVTNDRRLRGSRNLAVILLDELAA